MAEYRIESVRACHRWQSHQTFAAHCTPSRSVSFQTPLTRFTYILSQGRLGPMLHRSSYHTSMMKLGISFHVMFHQTGGFLSSSTTSCREISTRTRGMPSISSTAGSQIRSSEPKTLSRIRRSPAILDSCTTPMQASRTKVYICCSTTSFKAKVRLCIRTLANILEQNT